jgi:hypothetical protein
LQESPVPRRSNCNTSHQTRAQMMMRDSIYESELNYGQDNQ